MIQWAMMPEMTRLTSWIYIVFNTGISYNVWKCIHIPDFIISNWLSEQIWEAVLWIKAVLCS